MASPRQEERWRAASDPLFLLFLVTVVLCLARARDLPSVDLLVGSTSVTVTLADAALAGLGVAVLVLLLRGAGVPRDARWPLGAAVVFAAWLFASSLPNGSTATVAAGKLAELAVLAVAPVVLVRSRERLWCVVVLLVGFTVVAVVVALDGFAENPGTRQASFLGEHDLAALATTSLAVALAALFAPKGAYRRVTLVAGIAGSLGIVLGAPLASLLGLYLATAAIVAIAVWRRAATRRAIAIAVAVLAVVTAATYQQRSGDVGFLKAWFAPDKDAAPGAYAASWSQRLLFAYIGGRIFLDQPLLGTGWYGLLPPSEFARFLPDAHRRFSDQPSRYFPPADGQYIPQQTYDQLLYELGLAGTAFFVAAGALAARNAVRNAPRWPEGDADELVAYLPAAWLASLAGTLAGAALFGGTPIATLFWLTLGIVAVTPAIAPTPAQVDESAVARPAPATG